MAIIDPEILKQTQEGTIVQPVKDASGNILGWKGRFLPHVYDNFTEALKENQAAHRIAKLKERGLNEHGQTKEQEKEFNERKKRQLAQKEKSEMALIAAADSMRR